MKIQVIPHPFSVCQVLDYSQTDLEHAFCFSGKTDEECSLVCPTELVPRNTTAREDGWRAFRLQGVLDFSLIGVLARIADLLAREGRIPTTFGQTLSWEYLRYVRTHPVRRWRTPTAILYGARDHLTDRETVEAFATRNGCRLTVEEAGEHWFHTPQQLAAVDRWQRACLADLR